jgi:hypothetical protein
MSPQDWAGLAVAVFTLIGGLATAVRWMVKHYLYELKQSPEDALISMKQMYERVHLVHGQFITIFHNSILGLDELDKGWAAMYKQFLIWQQQYQASNIIL